MQPPSISRRAMTSAVAAAAAVTLLAGTPTLGASAATPAAAPGGLDTAASARATTVAPIPGNVRLYQTRTSLLGTHRWYQQVHNGHPVFGAWYARHTYTDGRVTSWDGRRDIGGGVGDVSARSDGPGRSLATLRGARAADAQRGDVADTRLMILPNDDGSARLTWAVHTANGDGAATSFVDAETGAVLDVIQLAQQHDAAAPAVGRWDDSGRGRVFDPNPVVAVQRQGLRDQADQNAAVPLEAYTKVDLLRLRTGLHTLVGRWVRITNSQRATSPDNRYLFFRGAERFEQVNAYHAIDTQQAYLQELGFRYVNAEAEKIAVNAFAEDNSYYDPSTDQIAMGRGGVDDAEDVEVIWHEYGHAIQSDQVPDWGLAGQTGSMGEGFGDYMAAMMSLATAPGTPVTPAACVADWDAVSYTTGTPHCLRRTDEAKQFPTDLTGEVHADGEIWSRALWDMRRKLGRDMATTIIVEAHFAMNPAFTMPQAARATVRTARLLYGDEVAADTRTQFEKRGILLED